MAHPSRLTCATLVSAALVAAPLAWGQDRDRSGPFIGASYGGYKAHGGDFDDENDLFGVSAGYRFFSFLSLEASYIDFGNFGQDDVDADLKGFSLSALAHLPLTSSFGIYGKVGAFAASLDVDAFDDEETYDEVSPVVGVGADFRVTPTLSAFAEYDRYNVDIDEDDFNGQINNDGPEFDTARVGVRFQF